MKQQLFKLLFLFAFLYHTCYTLKKDWQVKYMGNTFSMESYVYVILWTAAIFLAMILQLAAKPKFTSRLTGLFVICAFVGGLLIYGYAYTDQIQDIPLAVLQALLAVCGMFVSKMDFDLVEGYAFFQTFRGQFVFWLLHLFALYATASAAITSIGAEALKKLRLFLAHWGELHLIFGINERTMELCSKLLESGKTSIVFVDDKLDSGIAASIVKAGCVFRSDKHALNADTTFLRSVGIRRGNRLITLYALSDDSADNLSYAKKFHESLTKRSVLPAQSQLIISGLEDPMLKSLKDYQKQFFSISVFNEASLVSRVLMKYFPPYKQMKFDTNAKAETNFDALVVGFGQLGQAVLRDLILNGQFYGSKFHATVFAPDCKRVNGLFLERFHGKLKKYYDISFRTYDARSCGFYNYIKSRVKTINYVVLCTGSEQMNFQIAKDLNAFFQQNNRLVPIYQCSYTSVRCLNADGTSGDLHKIYDPEIISMRKLDRMAIQLNHYFTKDNPATPGDKWKECSAMSLASSRASADFIHAFLEAADISEENAKNGGWILSDEKKENLARTEHLRWCAFLYCMGVTPMSDADFESRVELYREKKAAGDEAFLKKFDIGKNGEISHRRLVPWELLDARSEEFNNVTGQSVSYRKKNMDYISGIPNILAAGREDI